MSYVGSVIIGYLLGCFNPASILGKRHKLNLRELGSKNLGASNVLLTMGKARGFLVMVVDIAKAFFAARIARLLFPKLAVGGMLAAFGAILGHIYPFHMGFRGGKGLAAFGGMVLAYNPWMFAALLALCCVLVVVVNYSFVAPATVAVLFPILVAVTSADPWMTLIAAAAGALIVYKHWDNFLKAVRGSDFKIRDIIAGKHRPGRE